MTKRRPTSAPAVLRRPKTRRDAAMPHYDVPANVPRSVLVQVANMRRCIIAEDGKPVSNNANWIEVRKDSFRVSAKDGVGHASFTTEDGRKWHVVVEEGTDG